MKSFRSLNISVLLVASIALSACHHALPKNGKNDEQMQGDGLAFPESSGVLSKWLRTNVSDYWSFARRQSLLAGYTASGVVVGDTHLANFAPIPVMLKSGKIEMKYFDIDFDDAGRAPFALDFLR